MTHFIFFTLFLTNSLEKCQTKSFENEYSTFCNFQILHHESTLQITQDDSSDKIFRKETERGENANVESHKKSDKT